MKCVLSCIAAIGAVLCANAYTEAETNEVLRTLAIMIELERGPDCLDENSMSEPMPESYQHYEELFTNYPTNEVGGTWTAQERQEAFESFLWKLPELSPDNVDKEVLFYADSLLEFCEWHNKTNFLPHAKRVLLSPYVDKLPTARIMFEKFARPSEETYRFVECMMTNRTETFMTRIQSYFLDSFGSVLLNHQNDTSPDIISNGVRLIRRSIEGMDGWNGFDLVMRKLYPDYAMSSNRLAFAITALDAEPSPGKYGQSLARDVLGYFTPITNTLLNASEPLKVLDLSWLDEPMTSGNAGNGNEQEQQAGNND